jgi:MFS family permease
MKELLRDSRIRRLLLANITGSIGSGITIIAIPWLLVQRPDGDRLYGYVTVASTIALFLIAPYYGAWLDRHSRKFALLAGELFGASATLTMAVWIALRGEAAAWQLLTLFFTGMLYYTLHYPAKFAFVQQVFDKRHYQQLVGLMEIQGQAASMLAGGLASVLLDHIPFHAILFFDAGTYLFSFLVMGTLPYVATHLEVPAAATTAWRALGEGLAWLRARPRFTVFIFCTMTPFIAVMTGNYLFPIYVQEVLAAPAAVFGRGEMAFAFGALLSGALGPRLLARYAAPNIALLMIALFTAGLVFLGALHTVAAFYVALLLLGLGNAGSRIARGSVVLHEVPNAIMGRVNVAFAAADRLVRTLLQFAAIYVVVRADASLAFIGLIAFVGLALALAWQSRKGLHRPAASLP